MGPEKSAPKLSEFARLKFAIRPIVLRSRPSPWRPKRRHTCDDLLRRLLVRPGRRLAPFLERTAARATKWSDFYENGSNSPGGDEDGGGIAQSHARCKVFAEDEEDWCSFERSIWSARDFSRSIWPRGARNKSGTAKGCADRSVVVGRGTPDGDNINSSSSSNSNRPPLVEREPKAAPELELAGRFGFATKLKRNLLAHEERLEFGGRQARAGFIWDWGPLG